MRLPLLLALAACRPTDKPAGDTADATDTADTDTADTDTADTDTADSDTSDSTSPDTSDSTDTASPAWNGLSPYRVVLTVPGYDPGGDGVDEGPARVDLDLAAALAALGIDGAPDLHTLQLVREAADGTPLAPSVPASQGLGAWDVPLRFADHDLWAEGYAYNFAATGSAVELTFTHRQEGAGDTRYALYFDLLAGDAATVSPRPGLGDMDLLHRADGQLASMIHSRPHLVDLDGDGLLDLVMGDSLGRVTLFRNEGDAADPVWVTQQLLTTADGAAIQKNYLAIPEVVDWDSDGDLDLLVGSEYGAIVTFYANTGGPGVPTFEDRGTLTADGAELQLPPEPCPEAPFYTADYTAAPAAVDWDADDDLDLLLGGYVTGEIFLYERDADGLHARGALEADGATIDTGWAASPVLVDLDADGDLDLLSGTFQWELPDGEDWPPFWAWENTAGPGATPTFTAWDLPLERSDPLAAGSLSTLTAGDVDADGVADLLVAAEGYAWLFRNVGTAAAPAFSYEDPLPQPMTPLPTGADGQPVDVDADGDLDLVNGGGSFVGWIESLGGGDPADWQAHGEGFTSDGAVILYSFDGGDDTSFPVLEDWESDGDLDLLVGTAEGWVDLYRALGATPLDGFGPAERLLLESGEPVAVGEPMDPKDTFEGHSGNRAQATGADLDGDGDRDLLVGDALGGLSFFRNTGSDAAPVFAAGTILLAVPGERLAPQLADWDDDGDLDLLLGRPSEVDLYPNVGGPTELVLGAPTRFPDPTVYYPHPYPIDWNGDGDLDLVVSSSYGTTSLAKRTWLDRGWLDAEPLAVESRDGATADWHVDHPTAWAYEADVLPSEADPAWTPFASEGTVADGVLTLGPDDSIYIGTLYTAEGADAWPGTDGSEVEVRLRVVDLADGQTDTVNLALSDGAQSWHLRWSPTGISFYGYDDVYPVDTLGWHTWRVAMVGSELRVCQDNTLTWTTPPSFAYARTALWLGDDGTGTGGTSQIDHIRWTTEGDGDPCTAW